ELLVVAVFGGPDEIGVARVHVQDPAGATPAQRDQTAAVDDDVIAGVVVDLGRLVQRDGDGGGATVEGDHSAFGDRVDELFRRAALGRAVSDHVIGIRDVLETGVARDRALTVRVARGRTVFGGGEGVVDAAVAAVAAAAAAGAACIGTAGVVRATSARGAARAARVVVAGAS